MTLERTGGRQHPGDAVGQLLTLARCAAVGVAALATGTALAQSGTGMINSGSAVVVDWEVDAEPAPLQMLPAPFLTDDNAAAVADFFASQPGNLPRVVKIHDNTTLAPNGPAAALFNSHKIDFVFADLESGDAVARTQDLVAMIQSSTESANAYIGNYDFKAPEGGVTMTNASLYPGSPSLFDPGSSAPNIRSQLFVKPVEKFKDFVAASPSAPHIPYVTRFNNWRNIHLHSDAANPPAPGEDYVFDTTTNSANPDHVNQMPSRADLQVQAATYRLLGANGLHVFTAAVDDLGFGEYTKEMIQDDAQAGWTLLDDTVGSVTSNTAVENTIEEELGLMWTSIAHPEQNPNSLQILVSNLSDATLDYAFGVIGDRTVGSLDGSDFEELLSIDEGHYLLDFTRISIGQGQNKENYWSLASVTDLFEGEDALLNRQAIGIPEPGSLMLAGLASTVLVLRRRRR